MYPCLMFIATKINNSNEGYSHVGSLKRPINDELMACLPGSHENYETIWLQNQAHAHGPIPDPSLIIYDHDSSQ